MYSFTGLAAESWSRLVTIYIEMVIFRAHGQNPKKVNWQCSPLKQLMQKVERAWSVQTFPVMFHRVVIFVIEQAYL